MTPEDSSRFEAIRKLVRKYHEDMRDLMIEQAEREEKRAERLEKEIEDLRRTLEALEKRTMKIEWVMGSDTTREESA